MKLNSLSHVRLFATPWTVAYQAPQYMELSRQEYWSGLPFPSRLSWLQGILKLPFRQLLKIKFDIIRSCERTLHPNTTHPSFPELWCGSPFDWSLNPALCHPCPQIPNSSPWNFRKYNQTPQVGPHNLFFRLSIGRSFKNSSEGRVWGCERASACLELSGYTTSKWHVAPRCGRTGTRTSTRNEQEESPVVLRAELRLR